MIVALLFLTITNLNEYRDQNLELWQFHSQESSVEMRFNALHKLTELRDPRALPFIIDRLEDEVPEIRHHAARSLTRFPKLESLDALQRRLNEEPDPYIQSEIRRSIQLLEELLDRLQERDSLLEEEIEEAEEEILETEENVDLE